MAYLFIDDNCPEADEYVSNYIYFDENDPQSLQKALYIARSKKRFKSDSKNQIDPAVDFFPAFSSSLLQY